MAIFFDMGEADFTAMEEIRRKEDEDIAEKIEKMRRKRERTPCSIVKVTPI
jgi:hypothetical protein